MNTLLLLAALALTGCATTLTNGTAKFRTYANAQSLRLTMPGITLSIDGMNHSTPTRAAFAGASHLAASVGTAALPFVSGTTTAVKAATILPSAIPAFRTRASSAP